MLRQNTNTWKNQKRWRTKHKRFEKVENVGHKAQTLEKNKKEQTFCEITNIWNKTQIFNKTNILKKSNTMSTKHKHLEKSETLVN